MQHLTRLRPTLEQQHKLKLSRQLCKLQRTEAGQLDLVILRHCLAHDARRRVQEAALLRVFDA